MATEIYARCDGCGNGHPGQLVEDGEGKRSALCLTCWDPVRGSVKVIDWINKDGKLQHA